MKRKLLVADLLCGAGGSSTGCQRALTDLGLEMELVAVNHWPTAIATHTLNHPTARHFVQDISTVRPHILVPEGYLDLLMASPTCTHHSVARGGKPTSDQQRSDPWHIITWLTELRVKRIIIENVWEFTSWGPVDHRTGKPVQSRKGEYFAAWIDTLKRLGFRLEWRKLNAADYGDATTRSRFILMGRSDGKRLAWPTPTHRRRDSMAGDLFSGSKPWRPAREIIDWGIKGRSIFDRKKALAPKTLARIYAGAQKHGWPEPFLVVLRNHMTAQGMDMPLPAITAGGTHLGLAQPVLIKQNFRRDVQGVDEPAPTVMTQARLGLAEPVVVNLKKAATQRSTDAPLPTLVSAASHVGLAEPIILSQHNSGAPRGACDPLPTITTGGAGSEDPGCARPMLVEPFILNRQGDCGPGTRAHAIDDPAPTATTAGAGYLVEPFVLSRHAEGSARSIDDPTPTQVAKHSHLLISPYYGSGSGETCASGEDPLPTATAKARFGMVVPVTQSGGGATARSLEDPVPTMTTARGGEFALIAAQFGEREGQAPRVHDIEEPTPTLCATGRVNLVEATETYDILFRMLEPHELAAAMGFNDEERRYEFTGTKTEQIKQIGNAVSVAKMRACVAAIMADAVPRSRDESSPFLEAAE